MHSRVALLFTIDTNGVIIGLAEEEYQALSERSSFDISFWNIDIYIQLLRNGISGTRKMSFSIIHQEMSRWKTKLLKYLCRQHKNVFKESRSSCADFIIDYVIIQYCSMCMCEKWCIYKEKEQKTTLHISLLSINYLLLFFCVYVSSD